MNQLHAIFFCQVFFLRKALLKIIAACIGWLGLAATSASGALYLNGGPSWNNFVFEAEDQEETANYYGYGARISFGYSLANVWDLGLYGHYTPGRLNAAELNREDARLWHIGFETAARLAKVLYIGVRGGPSLYRLSQVNSSTEVPGQWTGTMVQGSLGMLLPVTKVSNWLLSMDMGQAQVSKSDATGDDAKVRKISEISLSLSFVYNGLFSQYFSQKF